MIGGEIRYGHKIVFTRTLRFYLHRRRISEGLTTRDAFSTDGFALSVVIERW